MHLNIATAIFDVIKSRGLDSYFSLEEAILSRANQVPQLNCPNQTFLTSDWERIKMPCFPRQAQKAQALLKTNCDWRCYITCPRQTYLTKIYNVSKRHSKSLTQMFLHCVFSKSSSPQPQRPLVVIYLSSSQDKGVQHQHHVLAEALNDISSAGTQERTNATGKHIFIEKALQ